MWELWGSFTAKGNDRIFLGCLFGWNQAADEGQNHAQHDENNCIACRQLSIDGRIAGKAVDDAVYGDHTH